MLLYIKRNCEENGESLVRSLHSWSGYVRPPPAGVPVVGSRSSRFGYIGVFRSHPSASATPLQVALITPAYPRLRPTRRAHVPACM